MYLKKYRFGGLNEHLADKFLLYEDISHYGFKSFKHFRRKNVF